MKTFYVQTDAIEAAIPVNAEYYHFGNKLVTFVANGEEVATFRTKRVVFVLEGGLEEGTPEGGGTLQ